MPNMSDWELYRMLRFGDVTACIPHADDRLDCCGFAQKYMHVKKEENKMDYKFENGDKVQVVKMDVTWWDYKDHLIQYLGEEGTIDTSLVGIENQNHLCVRFQKEYNGREFWFMPAEWLKLIEKKKPEYWTGKIVITDSGDSSHFTTGKVYDVKNGLLFDRCPPEDMPYTQKKFENFKEVQDWLQNNSIYHIHCIEFKGEA